MQVVVLGAGVVGITTAHRLLRDGHRVTVLERAAAPATATSFANAGLVAPGHAYAWASPNAPRLMLRSLINGDQAIRFRPKRNMAQWRWLLAFLAQCREERTRANTAIKAALCLYAQSELHRTVQETGIAYEGRGGGLIYFYRSAAALDAASDKARMLRAQGVKIARLDRAELRALDPALEAAGEGIAGALYASGDESGDAHIFTTGLAKYCAARGGTFRYNTTIRRLRIASGRVEGVETDKGFVTADAYILCLGVHSPALLRRTGLRLPIYPVRGYSVTLPITAPAKAPRLGGVDEENLLAYCPMGARLRLTATAEIAGYDTSHKPADFAPMLRRAKALFGNCADFSRPEYWVGLRPMTPTGIPIVDRAPLEGLRLNTGHGHMGWTMSNGCAQILTDMIAGRRPAHSTEGMQYDQA